MWAVGDRTGYLRWAMHAVASANRKWAARTPNTSIPLMTRDSLHSWLYEAGIKGGWILPIPKDRVRTKPISHDVALAFEARPEVVKEAARAYWRYLTTRLETE